MMMQRIFVGNLAFINKTVDSDQYLPLCESISNVHCFYFTRISSSEMKFQLLWDALTTVKVLFNPDFLEGNNHPCPTPD